MGIGPRVGMRLTCFQDREYHVTAIVYTSWTDYYAVQTVWVDRPGSGSRVGVLNCAACGEPVGFRVYSEAATRLRAGLWLAATLVTGTVLALACWGVTGMGNDPSSGLNAPILGLMMAVVVIAFIASLMAIGSEDGVVRDDRTVTASSGHRFRRIGEWAPSAPVDNPPNPDLTFDLAPRPVRLDQKAPPPGSDSDWDNPATVLGLEPGTVVRELGWNMDVDNTLRFGIEEITGDDLLDEDGTGRVDCVLLWWYDLGEHQRTDPGDMLAKARAALTNTGRVWLFTPATGSGAGDPADITEVAIRCDLSHLGTVTVGNWTGYLLSPTEFVRDRPE